MNRGSTSLAKRFYRIIAQAQPSRDDFRSDSERGLLPPRNPDKVRYWQGRSVYATLSQARVQIAARRARVRIQGGTWTPHYVVEVSIPPNSPITAEEWGRSEGHHTLWGDTDLLFACLSNVFAGESDSEEGVR